MLFRSKLETPDPEWPASFFELDLELDLDLDLGLDLGLDVNLDCYSGCRGLL